MITPEQKDAILIKMVGDVRREWLPINSEYTGVNTVVTNALIKQFSENGLVEIKSTPGKQDDTFIVYVNLEADDFLNHGGHKFKEDIFRLQFDKLVRELEKLEDDVPKDKLRNVYDLIGAISSGLSIYTGVRGII